MKKIMIFATVALTSVVTVWVNKTNEEAQTSETSLVNVEALSRREIKGYEDVTYIRYPWGIGCNCYGEGSLTCC